ncbi:hypothetical protein J6590_106373, partial [Homalodisca vitripennis]
DFIVAHGVCKARSLFGVTTVLVPHTACAKQGQALVPDHKHATSTATRHPYRPPSNKSLTPAPKRARPSIIRISSGREFQRRHA